MADVEQAAAGPAAVAADEAEPDPEAETEPEGPAAVAAMTVVRTAEPPSRLEGGGFVIRYRQGAHLHLHTIGLIGM
tara:strand:- start:470 stop:697 length:228 start_codon:yes stop_codon:yes gene_type:complete